MFRLLKTYQLVVDLVLAGVFALFVIVFEYRGLLWESRGAFVGMLITILLMTAALVFRRLSPGLALALAWAGAIVQMATGRQPGVVDFAIFAVLYTTAAYGSRVVFWLGFSSTIVGAGVITAYLFGERLAYVSVGDLIRDLIPTAVAVLFAALFALLLSWTVGALVRSTIRAREIRRAQEEAEAQTVAEQERTRIARDMHDVVAHSLTVVIAQADGARYAAASDPAAATTALDTISTTARSALADVRLLLTQLRHSQSEGPQPSLADLEQLYAQVRAAGVDLFIDVDPAPPGEPPAGTQLAVYRILQEALTNALRHGDGGPVDVSLAWRPDRVDLAVRNGVATDASAGAQGADRGHGLIGMRERAQLAGGRLDAGLDGEQFAVRAMLPIEGAGL